MRCDANRRCEGGFGQNHAGVEQKNATIAEIEEEDWERIVDTNLRGVFLCMKYEIPLMLKQGGGAIVNTSSGAGVIGIKGGAAYTAAKHSVIGLTKSAALDYAAQNIRVNAVALGYIVTPMMDRFTGGTGEGWGKVIAEEPIGRASNPEEIADAVIWLCSDAASFVVDMPWLLMAVKRCLKHQDKSFAPRRSSKHDRGRKTHSLRACFCIGVHTMNQELIKLDKRINEPSPGEWRQS